MKHVTTIIRLLFLAAFIFFLAIKKPMLWLVLFAASLLAALIFGRVYCGYVCPMNTLMVPAEWVAKKLKIGTLKAPKWLKSGYFSWISLAFSIAALILLRKFFQINLPILPIWLAIAVVITLIFGPAVFHNLICPFGALQKLFGRFARVATRVNKDTCIGCKLCEKVCPSEAIAVSEDDKKAAVNKALCHQCTNCRQACPKGAIKYSA